MPTSILKKPSLRKTLPRLTPYVFLLRAQLLLLAVGMLYGALVVLIFLPWIQTHVVYKTSIDVLGFTRFDKPEKYGLAPGKTINFHIPTADNTTIGAWFILADSVHRSLPFPPPGVLRTVSANSSSSSSTFSSPHPTAIPRKADIRHATLRRPTVLFLHGNTATRAHSLRVNVYTGLTGRLDVNVLAIDYRGFGDSEGMPTVNGVARDARAAWDFLTRTLAVPESDVLIVGHSLGTAVTALLSAELGKEGIRPRGVVLMAPFSSVRLLMDQYHLFGFLPLLKPLGALPVVPRVLSWSLMHNFDTLSLVPDIKSDVLILHAEDDEDIGHTHANVIFNALLDPYLPPRQGQINHPDLHQPLLLSDAAWHVITAQQAMRAAERKEMLTSVDVPQFGRIETFETRADGGRKLVLLKTTDGGHDIGRNEGVQDVIGRTFELIGNPRA